MEKKDINLEPMPWTGVSCSYIYVLFLSWKLLEMTNDFSSSSIFRVAAFLPISLAGSLDLEQLVAPA